MRVEGSLDLWVATRTTIRLLAGRSADANVSVRRTPRGDLTYDGTAQLS